MAENLLLMFLRVEECPKGKKIKNSTHMLKKKTLLMITNINFAYDFYSINQNYFINSTHTNLQNQPFKIEINWEMTMFLLKLNSLSKWICSGLLCAGFIVAC